MLTYCVCIFCIIAWIIFRIIVWIKHLSLPGLNTCLCLD
jgi:hypothetical protein